MATAVLARTRPAAVGDLAGIAVKAALAALLAFFGTIAPPSPRVDIRVGLAAETRQVAFSIVGWEIASLAEKARPLLATTSSATTHARDEDQQAAVRAHFANVAEIRRLRGRRDELFARGDRDVLVPVETD